MAPSYLAVLRGVEGAVGLRGRQAELRFRQSQQLLQLSGGTEIPIQVALQLVVPGGRVLVAAEVRCCERTQAASWNWRVIRVDELHIWRENSVPVGEAGSVHGQLERVLEAQLHGSGAARLRLWLQLPVLTGLHQRVERRLLSV